MGKSLKALFNGTVDRVYGEKRYGGRRDVAQVYMGDWKAIRHEPRVGDGKWQLHNLVTDPTETANVADRIYVRR